MNIFLWSRWVPLKRILLYHDHDDVVHEETGSSDRHTLHEQGRVLELWLSGFFTHDPESKTRDLFVSLTTIGSFRWNLYLHWLIKTI